MENTGGEPDVVSYDQQKDEYLFVDCSPESPKGRRSLCYDREALEARKDHPPIVQSMWLKKWELSFSQKSNTMNYKS